MPQNQILFFIYYNMTFDRKSNHGCARMNTRTKNNWTDYSFIEITIFQENIVNNIQERFSAITNGYYSNVINLSP